MVGWGTLAISEELVEFIESGMSMMLATRDAELHPDCVRLAGAQVSADRKSITVRVPERTGARSLANIAAGSPIAITVSRPIDYRSVQIKGRCVGVRPSGEADQRAAERYHAGFVEALYAVGMPRRMTQRFRIAPCVIVDIAVAELFHQTPGPEAGTPLPR